jgi:pimeloyl-ACP methyl ester carboxylesterase
LVHEFRALLTEGPNAGYVPGLDELPKGKGQAVLVVPGFLTYDRTTRSLRSFLEDCGFRAYGWDGGVNWGPTQSALAQLRRRLDELNMLTGGPVILIGISLGGLLARDLAHDAPDRVAHVVTLASPFRLPTASTLEPLVQLCSPFYSANVRHDRLAEPLPMPSTAFFTYDDGVVAWQSCRSDEPLGVNIAVTGAHMTIGQNPQVRRLLVERLATISPSPHRGEGRGEGVLEPKGYPEVSPAQSPPHPTASPPPSPRWGEGKT